jgi:hypothetical protein
VSFHTPLRVEKVHGTSTKWILLDVLIYKEPGGKEHRVPKGFETDLSTNWFRGRHDEASVLHDYLLSQHWSFKRANRVMDQAMKDSKVRWLHRKIINFGIGLNGLIQDR